MAEAIKDTPADEFELTIQTDGSSRSGAVEVVEKIRPLRLTPHPVRQRERTSA